LDDQLFWELTPREIQACFDAWRADQERWNVRAGTIAAAIFNVKRTKRRDPVLKWSDFFQPLRHRPRIASAEEINAKLSGFAALGAAKRKQKAEGLKKAQEKKNAKPSRPARKGRH
jgi:hypothetical protein